MEFFIALFGSIWLLSVLSREQHSALRYQQKVDRNKAAAEEWNNMVVNLEEEYNKSGLFESFVKSRYSQGKFAESLKKLYGGKLPVLYKSNRFDMLMYKMLFYSTEGMLPEHHGLSVDAKQDMEFILRGYELVEKNLREHGIPAYFVRTGNTKIEGEFAIMPIQVLDEDVLAHVGYYRMWGPKALIIQDGRDVKKRITQLIREEEAMERESRE